MAQIRTEAGIADPAMRRERPLRRAPWHRHRYPGRFVGPRQETMLAFLFGAVGLLITALAFSSAGNIVCALSDPSEGWCATATAPDAD